MGADSPELALLALSEVWMCSTAALTAPHPSWRARGSPGNCSTTLITTFPGPGSDGNDCSVLWGTGDHMAMLRCAKSAAICGVILGKLKIKAESKVCWNGCDKVTNAVIYNEAVIYSPALLTVFCQFREKEFVVSILSSWLMALLLRDHKQGKFGYFLDFLPVVII